MMRRDPEFCWICEEEILHAIQFQYVIMLEYRRSWGIRFHLKCFLDNGITKSKIYHNQRQRRKGRLFEIIFCNGGYANDRYLFSQVVFKRLFGQDYIHALDLLNNRNATT